MYCCSPGVTPTTRVEHMFYRRSSWDHVHVLLEERRMASAAALAARLPAALSRHYPPPAPGVILDWRPLSVTRPAKSGMHTWNDGRSALKVQPVRRGRG